MGDAASRLRGLPFRPFAGSNNCNDDFSLLLAVVPIERYAELQRLERDPETRRQYRNAAEALQEVGYPVRFIAVEPDTTGAPGGVAAPSPSFTSEEVDAALRDADVLLSHVGGAAAVDRVHTAFHGYLRHACGTANLTASANASVTELLKLLREQHPALLGGPHAEELRRIFNSMGTIVDAGNTLRNKASGTHPAARLEEPEAHLVINSLRTLFHFLDGKIRPRGGR